MAYGCQTWSLKASEERKIKVMQNSMQRSILNIKIKDKVRVSKIRNILQSNIDFLHAIRRLKWDWAGHVARMGGNRWAKLLTDWIVLKKRKKGKQKKRWRDEIDNMLGHNCHHQIAQDRCEWMRLKEAFAQQRAT